MDLANTRIPNPEEVEGDFFDLPYVAGTVTFTDGYWEPIIGIQRYWKLRLSKDYVTWVLDGEINT